MKILIVDDNAENLYMLEALLKWNLYEIVPAANGKEALKRLRSEGADMIISDILMPVMDGFMLCREVRADETLKHIPLIFYTATYTNEKDEEFALKMGADKFLRKPMDPNEFMKIIKEVIKDVEEGKFRSQESALKKTEETLGLYSERLVKKLEKKMLDLEKEITKRKRAEEELKKHREHLEETVKKRTTELQKTINLMSDREIRMAGLKKAIKKLREQLESAGLTPVADDPVKEMGRMERDE